jgi:hypothetical protein
MLPNGGCEAVDEQVDGAHVGLEGVDDAAFHLVRKRIAVQGLCIEPGRSRCLLERDVVVPAGAGGALLARHFLERNAKGSGAAAERGDDSRGQAISARGADDQGIAHDGPTDQGCLPGDVIDLLFDVRGAAGRVRCGADESTNAGRDDHGSNRCGRAP